MKPVYIAIAAVVFAAVAILTTSSLRENRADTAASAETAASGGAPAPQTALAPSASQPAQPMGEVLLTITGGPDANGAMLSARFDLAGLQSLPVTKFETATMWTEGVQQFEGVSLKTLLKSLSVTSGTLLATAINDYRIEIPIAELDEGAPIIAYLRNGAPMSVRDKGPLWVVYPYDREAKYQTEVVFSRSIWQLNRLEIVP